MIRALGTFGFEVVNTRGSHAKLRRITPDGLRQVLTLPLHDELAAGTLHAIYRQALRYVPADELRSSFFTGGEGTRSKMSSNASKVPRTVPW